jgi:hypothetical protein
MDMTLNKEVDDLVRKYGEAYAAEALQQKQCSLLFHPAYQVETNCLDKTRHIAIRFTVLSKMRSFGEDVKTLAPYIILDGDDLVSALKTAISRVSQDVESLWNCTETS